MPGWVKIARNLAGAGVLVVVLLLIAVWFWSYPARPGKFYRADVPEGTAHGHLLKSEPFRRNVPQGASARRILYTTTLNGGVPALASALVLWKEDAPASPDATRRLIVWAHGTSGAVPGCGASMQRNPFEDTPVLEALLDEGWVFVATDYAGLTTEGPSPYMIGDGAARSMLDSALAAHDLEELNLSLDTVLWGYSQGGHAALWSGILARRYAPELEIRGIAAISPPTDLPAMMTDTEDSPDGRLFSSYVARSYADTYPDLYFSGIVRPGAQWAAAEMAKRCIRGRKAMVQFLLATELSEGTIFRGGDTATAFRRRLAENVPSGPIRVPILILQGKSDDVVKPQMQAGYARARCAAGETVDLQLLDRQSHDSIIAPGTPATPELMKWTRARFEGRPAPNLCPK